MRAEKEGEKFEDCVRKKGVKELNNQSKGVHVERKQSVKETF